MGVAVVHKQMPLSTKVTSMHALARGNGATGFTPPTTYHTAQETLSKKDTSVGRKRGNVLKVDVHLEDGL